MDEKRKKCCPNCSQFYLLKSLSPKSHGNVPLFLACGHSMCENCIRNIVKFGEPIQCKVCIKDMEISTADLALLLQNKLDLYKLFPVNLYMLGELTYEQIQQVSETKHKNENDYFTDLKIILQDCEKIQVQCMECHSPTTKVCKQCETTLCNTCFNKIHKNFVVFRNHVLQNIDSIVNRNVCTIHKDKNLDYYCKACSKAICMDCMMVGGEKSCKTHDVVSMQEVNQNFLEELTDITPKVDETYRRLTKTAVDIGHIMYNLENNSGTPKLTQLIHDVNQHFSQLFLIIQKHKNEVVDIIVKLQSAKKESLDKAKNEVTFAIKETKKILNIVKTIDEKNLKQMNMCSILEEAKKIVDIPWFLNEDVTNENIKVTVNEDLVDLLSDYIHLEGSSDTKYKLLTTQELNEQNIDIPAPPPIAVHPPELPKDVRQKSKAKPEKEKEAKPALYTQVPKYRNKSGSCSSLNSITSDTSNRSGGGSYQNQMVQPVSPFPDSQHPKQLYEGTQELIYISHIVNPHNFFVQRACHQPLLQDMLREFRNAVSLPKPPLNHVAEGKFYLAFNKADNMWQRCRVMSIDRKDPTNPRFHVFCVDFGSSENVSIDKLRYLPPARIHAPPSFAINCCLANCEPRNGVWTSEDAILMQNIINNKQAVIHIRDIRSTSNYTVTYECDLTTYEECVSLIHALVFHERAKMSNPKLPYPKLMSVTERPKIYSSHNDFQPNTEQDVYITHITSPDQFCVRKQHVQGVYEKLCEDLDQEYSLGANSGNIYLPEIGMVCAVNVNKHIAQDRSTQLATAGEWARGVVREVPGGRRVRVWLPDVGAVLLVHWTALRQPAPHFFTLRALAVECHLAGVTPLNKKWSLGSVTLLKHFENRLLHLHVEDSRNRGSLGVTLYDKNDPDDIICINQEMIKMKYAVSFGVFMFNKNNDINDQVITHKTPLDKPKVQIKPKKNTVAILQKSKAPPQIEDLEAKDKGPLRLEIKILHYQSPSLFYVSLIHQEKTFVELSNKMQKYYSKMQNPSQGKNTWQVGDRCCTICIESQTWRRAAILEIAEDIVKVFYSDFACVETVPMLGLRELTKDFASIGDAAFKCHLCGVMPAVGEEWPSLTKEYLKELIDAYQRIFITKHGNFKDKSMPVELWVYHTVQGGALEPNTSEWRCLNQKIIQQGLGIPDKNPELTEVQNDDENMLSFLNVTGSVNEWLQLEQLPMKPLNKTKCLNSDEELNSQSSTPVDCDLDTVTERVDKDKNTIFISDWQEPEPLPSSEFMGIPTYVDNDGIIYLHAVNQQDTLDLIRKALDVRFKKPDPKAKFAKWTVGEPCIALYYLDNQFYRGRVLEVNDEESKCLIHYIDYGNEETCAFINMRKSIALYQIPTQAHKCVLDRIRPINNVYDRQSLDYIHKSVVEKKCFIKVSGSAVEGVIPIKLKYNKLWINDHLVEFEMAAYTDGSKAVTRKFASAKNKKAEVSYTVESDSGPDYILEEDSSTVNESTDSLNMESLRLQDIHTDWNKLLEDEGNSEFQKNILSYPKQEKKTFTCNIVIINDTTTLELTILHDDEEAKLYENMFEKLQNDANDMTPLNGIYENKACVAVFPEDNQWYRASILQYSEAKNRVKVKFVDYGNIEVISPADVREITQEYVNLPSATISANLYGIKLNNDIDINVVTQQYTDTFLDKGPFQCKIVNYNDSIPQVELRNNKNELVYEDLIKKNIFLLST